MKIAVASGKGGTGKTTIATSLALTVSAQGQVVSYLDCDVEAPNAHLFLHPNFDTGRQVNRLVPGVNTDICSGCGRCAEVCQFHAIVVLGGKPLVFPELCHGCGSCSLECPENAITETPETLGILEAGTTPEGIHIARGLLDIGEPMAVPVIRQLKQWQLSRLAGIVILDSPPGTSCPVVESIRGADFLLLVTEPTPFGLHDLKLAVQLARELEISAGVVINRNGVGDIQVEAYCQQVGLPVLMRIPLEREIGEGIARGKTLLQIRPEFQPRYNEMLAQIMDVQAVGVPR